MIQNHLKLTFILWSFFFVISCHNIDFDTGKWRDYNEIDKGGSLRWDMSDDLINNYDLIGKDTTAVFDLLGVVQLHHSKHSFIAYYPLGNCRSSISVGTLDLTFEAN